MTEEQFRILLANRQPRRALRLDELSPKAQMWAPFGRRYVPPLTSVLRKAARQVRQREAAQKAWHQVVPPAWLDYTQVLGIEDGMIEIGVAHATVLYDIRRQKTKLERRLSQLVEGARGLRFVTGPEAGEPSTPDMETT
jgi:hypothetical protein